MDFWSEPTTKEKKGYSHHTNSRKRKKSPYPLLCYWYFSSIVLKNQRKRSWHPDQTGREREEVSPPHPLLLIVDRSSPGNLLHTLDTDWSSIQCTFSTQNMRFLCEGRISYIYCAKLPLYPFWAVARISWWPRHWQYNDTEYQYGTLFHFICSWYFPSRTNVILGCLCYVLHIIGFETDRCALHHSGENRRNRIINWTMCLWDGWGENYTMGD